MARFRRSERETRWMVALYAAPGATLVVALLIFALVGYPFATRLLAMLAAVLAAMLVGLGAWHLASRSPRRPLIVGLVAAAHLIAVVGFPTLALTAYSSRMLAGKYAGLTFWTVPVAIWNGITFSHVHGVWFTVVGPRRRPMPANRDVPS